MGAYNLPPDRHDPGQHGSIPAALHYSLPLAEGREEVYGRVVS